MGLLSTGFLGLLIGVTLAVAVGAVLVEIRRHRRLRAGRIGRLRANSLRVLSVAMVLLLGGLSLLDEVNRQFDYFPSFAALAGHPSPDLVTVSLGQSAIPGRAAQVAGHGIDLQVTIAGARSHIRRRAYVYLPPQYYEPAWRHRRFGVLYLIHGSPGQAVDWIRGGRIDRTMDHLLAKHVINPLIVVMPDANGGFLRDLECANVPHGPQDQTYLADDVVHWADTHLRTAPDRWHRAIGGLSTGGYCGVNLGLRHQDVFSAIVSHSGAGQPDHDPFTADIFGGQRSLAWANTPVDYLRSLRIRPGMAVYLDAGTGDPWSRPRTTRLATDLRARRVPTTFHLLKGEGHTFSAFARDANLSLVWLSHWFAYRTAPTLTDVIPAPSGNYLPPLPPHYRSVVRRARRARPTR